jgi:hypothetical protein
MGAGDDPGGKARIHGEIGRERAATLYISNNNKKIKKYIYVPSHHHNYLHCPAYMSS